MKLLQDQITVLIALVFCVSLVQGAQWLQEVKENKEKPNHCLDPVTKDFYAVDNTWKRPGVCERLRCGTSPKSGILLIQGHTCPYPTSVPANCRLVGDVKLDYPECCPQLVCDDKDDTRTQTLAQTVGWVG